MAKLHASPDGAEIKDFMDDFACGWVRMKRDGAGGLVLWYNGSNTMWYIVIWLAPEKDLCVFAGTNVAGRWLSNQNTHVSREKVRGILRKNASASQANLIRQLNPVGWVSYRHVSAARTFGKVECFGYRAERARNRA